MRPKKDNRRFFKNSVSGELIIETDSEGDTQYQNPFGQTVETYPGFLKGYVEIKKKTFEIAKRRLEKDRLKCGFFRATIKPPFDGLYLVKHSGGYDIALYEVGVWSLYNEIFAWSFFSKTDINSPF